MDSSIPRPLLVGLITLFGGAVFLAVLNGWLALSFHQPLESIRPWTWLYAPQAWRLVRPEAFDQALQYAMLSGGSVMMALLALAFRPPVESPHGDARWATRREMGKAGLIEPHGILLGKLGGVRSFAPFLQVRREDHSNVLLVAPPGAGKGVGVVIPTLLTYPGSTIVLDVKGENFDATARRRQAMGDNVYRFSPYDPDGQTHLFNPLDAVARMEDEERRFTELRRIASHLLVAKGKSDEPFIDGARELFSALASIVVTTKVPTIGHVYRLLAPVMRSKEDQERRMQGNNGGEVAPADMAARFAQLADQARIPAAVTTLSQFAAYDQKTIAVYLSVLKASGLGAWGDPAVDRATASSDFDLAALRRTPASIYLVIGPNDMEALGPVARLFFQSAIAALQRNLPTEKEPFPVLLVLDEFKSLGRMEAISNAATTLRGYGGRMLIVVQGAPNLEEVYGRAGRDGLMNACQVHAYMSLNDASTKEMVSRSLGSREIRTPSESTSRTTGRFGFSRTVSEQTRAKRLLTEDEIGRLGADDILILAQNLRPIRARKVRYYADRSLKRLYRSQEKAKPVEVLKPIAGKPENVSALPNDKAARMASMLNVLNGARDSVKNQTALGTAEGGRTEKIAGFLNRMGKVRKQVEVSG